MALRYDKIVLFGDSITEAAYDQERGFCLGAALQNMYNRRLDILLRGYGGYNSSHGAAIIDKLIAQEHTSLSKIRLLIIFFGTNDCVDPVNIQHVPLEQFKKNIHNIAQSARSAGIPILLIGPAPFNAHKFKFVHSDLPLDRSTLFQRIYCDTICKVAAEIGVPAVPLWDDIMAEVGWKEGMPTWGLEETVAENNPLEGYFWDGLHFSGPAYEAEFRGITKAISQHYPELVPDSMRRKLPSWDEISCLKDLEMALQ